ncbi:MAG: single-stranded-DNA-specific exonuclease RecJ [Lachnospiraceae bacterium]|nr:single-stranded-DNA-specific exonuclease RecJ [Lachnospiraceae bacterium]
MANWVIVAKKADFDEIGREFGISPVLARLIRNRDIIEKVDIKKYLYGTIDDLYDPFLLKGMREAAAILADKIAAQAPLRVIGDYDVDGVCAAYILHKGLSSLDAAVDAVLPHRMKDGYGLNENLVSEAAAAGIDTIITCDNGISAVPQIALAKEKGLTVIVTDHHEAPFAAGEERAYQLPPADAIIDPKQPGCPYPDKQICGATVALKAVEALYGHLHKAMPEAMREEMRCLAGIATVCDVIPLRDENRLLVRYALANLKKCGNIGLKALIEANGLADKEIKNHHIGFIIGPCLNAAGRLESAELGLSLLRATDAPTAMTLAAEVKELNESRKALTEKGIAAAVALVEEQRKEGALDAVLVLYLADCHESIAGIIAGRIRERYHRPTFVLTDSEQGLKGSGRSIDAYNMHEELCKCAELFTNFGGHRQAAGLSMARENRERFRQCLNENASLTADDLVEQVQIDIALPFPYATKQLVEELDIMEPFGLGNRKPLFAQKEVSLLSGKVMGQPGNTAKYRVADSAGRQQEIIYFGAEKITAFDDFLRDNFSAAQVERLYRAGGDREGLAPMKIKLAYCPSINEYMGQRNVQLEMKHYGP